MPHTRTGWILIAAVLLLGAGDGHSFARALMTARDGREIERRDVGGIAVFGVLMSTSALLL